MSSVCDVVREVLGMLVNQEYSKIEEITQGKRLSAQEIQEAVSGYGRTLVMPPGDIQNNVNAILVRDRTPPEWSVVVSLWTVEEGLSDLSLVLYVTEGPFVLVVMDDIHVR